MIIFILLYLHKYYYQVLVLLHIFHHTLSLLKNKQTGLLLASELFIDLGLFFVRAIQIFLIMIPSWSVGLIFSLPFTFSIFNYVEVANLILSIFSSCTSFTQGVCILTAIRGKRRD